MSNSPFDNPPHRRPPTPQVFALDDDLGLPEVPVLFPDPAPWIEEPRDAQGAAYPRAVSRIAVDGVIRAKLKSVHDIITTGRRYRCAVLTWEVEDLRIPRFSRLGELTLHEYRVSEGARLAPDGDDEPFARTAMNAISAAFPGAKKRFDRLLAERFRTMTGIEPTERDQLRPEYWVLPASWLEEYVGMYAGIHVKTDGASPWSGNVMNKVYTSVHMQTSAESLAEHETLLRPWAQAVYEHCTRDFVEETIATNGDVGKLLHDQIMSTFEDAQAVVRRKNSTHEQDPASIALLICEHATKRLVAKLGPARTQLIEESIHSAAVSVLVDLGMSKNQDDGAKLLKKLGDDAKKAREAKAVAAKKRKEKDEKTS